jgi:hypothetical protein
MASLIDETSWGFLILIAFGLFSIAGALFDWDWFMEDRRARFIVKILGRSGARVFYVLLGIAMIILAFIVRN